MQDLTNGRINTNNLTGEEWDLVRFAYTEDWFVPDDEQWLLMRNLLGLFEIRRGYSIEVDADGDAYLLTGTVNIKLNEHGIAAWDLLIKDGRFYQSGNPTTYEDMKPHMTDHEIGMMEWM